MHATLQHTIDELVSGFEQIPEDRRLALESLARFMARRLADRQVVKLIFICTHNSRRSHMAQLWAMVAAAHYGLEMETYSGGTEATAFSPCAVEAMRRVGFVIESPGGDNPHYRVSYADDAPTIACFSKTYDDPFNPQQDFVAVMTCSDADAACPFVAGASLRASISYDDPKAADGTAEETAVYDARCRQIGTEMLFLCARAATSQVS